MKQILFLSILLLSCRSFALVLIPYEVNIKNIAHCKSGTKANGKEPSMGLLPWSREESGFDSFIEAINENDQIIYRFGNKKGQSFDSSEEKVIALDRLIKDGICPTSSEI